MSTSVLTHWCFLPQVYKRKPQDPSKAVDPVMAVVSSLGGRSKATGMGDSTSNNSTSSSSSNSADIDAATPTTAVDASNSEDTNSSSQLGNSGLQ